MVYGNGEKKKNGKKKKSETDLKVGDEGKEDHVAIPNQSNWTILLSAFGTRGRRFLIQSQLLLRLKNISTGITFSYTSVNPQLCYCAMTQ